MELIELLNSTLAEIPALVDENGRPNKQIITYKALQFDEELITLLLSDSRLQEEFFKDVQIGKESIPQFDQQGFLGFINQKNFTDNSFTRFAGKIGLAIDGRAVHNNTNPRNTQLVELVWPFKDCVLEGGQDHEDTKRNEVFFNQQLARDEITKLFEPKVFTNATRISDGANVPVTEFTRDAELNRARGLPEDTICDNLFIRGNNLLALHSIANQFAECVKLIYIDPPYNTGSDSFRYNDSFNEAAWLTFMQNRLAIARELLSDDGAIFVQIDHHQLGTLIKVMDGVFGEKNRISIITVKTSGTGGFKGQNPGPTEVTEYILFYTKNAEEVKAKLTKEWDYKVVLENPMETTGVKNYDLVIDDPSKDPKDWVFTKIKEVLMGELGFKDWREFKKTHGDASQSIYNDARKQFMLANADRIVSRRDPTKPSDKLKALLDESKANRNTVRVLEREDDYPHLAYNGALLAFFGRTKVRDIDGKATIVDQLTNLWTHISWAGIAAEGGVKLKNGKKPEKLLQQIIEIWTEEGDIVLDYHLGSGTTAAVAHKMGRQYIGMEQLHYGDSDPTIRLTNVIGGDKSGVSVAVGWGGGGSFVSLEMKKYNQEFIERIEAADSTDGLLVIWGDMKEKAFIHYSLDMSKLNSHIDDFIAMDIAEQKTTLLALLDKNHLYVNLSSLGDEKFECSDEETVATSEFYGLE